MAKVEIQNNVITSSSSLCNIDRNECFNAYAAVKRSRWSNFKSPFNKSKTNNYYI